MEVVSGNDGLLTNIEVLDVIRENRESRGLGSQQHSNVKISLQNRELIETKVVLYIVV